MTREEAIDYNKNLRMYMKLSDKNQPYKFLEENYIALDMAIQALEQQPCEDAISRADVKKYLSAPDANGDRVIYESDLDLLPPVTPQPKIGKPIYDETYHTYQCSNCRKIIGKTINFCPNCGAEMQEVEE